jgi:hypothetical protein
MHLYSLICTLCILLYSMHFSLYIELTINSYIVFYTLYSLHHILCNVLNALYYMHCIPNIVSMQCIIFYALYSMLCILSDALYLMHCILCTNAVHCILCIAFYALYCIYQILCIVFLALDTLCIAISTLHSPIIFYVLYSIHCIL